MGEFTEAPLCQAWGGGTNTKGGGAALKVLQRKCPFWWLQSLYGLLLPLFTDGDSEAEEGHPACSSCQLEGVGVGTLYFWGGNKAHLPSALINAGNMITEHLLYACHCSRRQEYSRGSSLVAQWVEDLALSLPWCGFDPWLGNFCMLQVWPEKKKKEYS